MVKQRFTLPFQLPFPFQRPPTSPPSFPGMGIYGVRLPTPDNIRQGIFDAGVVGYKVDIVADNCNTAISVAPRYLSVRFPPVQIVHRNPYCRERQYPPVQLPIPDDKEEPGEMDEGCGVGMYFVYENYRLSYGDGGLERNAAFTRYVRGEVFRDLVELNFRRDINNDFVEIGEFNGEGYHIAATLNVRTFVKFNTSNARDNNITVEDWAASGGIPGNPNELNSIWSKEQQGNVTYFFRAGGRFIGGAGGIETDSSYTPLIVNENLDDFRLDDFRANFATANRQSSTKQDQTFIQYDKPFTETIISDYAPRKPELVEQGTTVFGTRFFVYSCYELSFDAERVRARELCVKSPPPPPDMSCNCCPNIQQNDELLRLILKRIGTPVSVQIFDENLEREGSQQATKTPETLFKASKLAVERTEISNRLIGIENFPVKVPDTMIEPFKEGIFENIFGFFEGEKERSLKSVTELIAWMAEQDSAVLGQFHQVVEFEQDFDGDGNIQKETVVLPNVAETLKEVILLLVQLANNEGTKVHALAKILIEISNIKANLFKTMNTVVDIQDYLDYPTLTKTVEVPLAVDLTLDKETQDFVDFFKESKGKITYEDWDGTNSLHDNMLDLMQMATMLRAILYQRTEQE
ncbi:hypothetical protein [Calothrix sp. PCC 6303]|uniref:hypothetical protein n=1 Tax=Calothrix sp. PCC 6303 TaxID=1170562 RepID=UPI0002A00227|nr:hypothetical protein [Calothrix sp. PCC 6303]AFZ01633.1 hypothetical protein Cal6303_2660 [Calothrix sp. PCC 6303]